MAANSVGVTLNGTSLRVPTYVDLIDVVVTAAQTVTLTDSSPKGQYFTGISTATVVLPDASTLVAGESFKIVNRSTGAVAIQSNDTTLMLSLLGLNWVYVTCIDATGVTPASWSIEVGGSVV